MAITQADIDRLETALTTGELSVEYDGKRVTFRSIDDLTKALAYAKTQVSAATSKPDHSYAGFSRD